MNPLLQLFLRFTNACNGNCSCIYLYAIDYRGRILLSSDAYQNTSANYYRF